MKFDVTVVGAGPAGSTTAKFLAEKGVKVLLIDKDRFPRDKPCGGGIPLRTLKRFRYLREEDDLIDSYSYGGYAYSPSLKYRVELQKNEPLLAMVIRKKFDHGLVKLAVNSGAVFIDNRSAEDIKILRDKTRVTLNNGEHIESQIVIGADGIWSNIAKKSGMIQNRRNICICIFQEYQMSKEILDRFFTEKRLGYLHFNIQGICGYGWVFPKKERINIGVAEFQHAVKNRLKKKMNLKEVYTMYIKILRKTGVIPDNIKVEEVKGAALPIYPAKKICSNRIVLCGDAAGLANPATGEGIYYAMSSGKIAADVVTKSLETGDTSAKFLSRYQQIWEKDFGREMKILFRISKRRWGRKNEKIFRLIESDKKTTDMLYDIIIGQSNIMGYRWKMIQHILYLYLKDKFKSKK